MSGRVQGRGPGLERQAVPPQRNLDVAVVGQSGGKVFHCLAMTKVHYVTQAMTHNHTLNMTFLR